MAVDAGEQDAEIARVRKLGYNADDYDYEVVEFENCVHESVYPKGYDRRANFMRPKQKAKQYKFTLDKFQDRAVLCIEKDEKEIHREDHSNTIYSSMKTPKPTEVLAIASSASFGGMLQIEYKGGKEEEGAHAKARPLLARAHIGAKKMTGEARKLAKHGNAELAACRTRASTVAPSAQTCIHGVCEEV